MPMSTQTMTDYGINYDRVPDRHVGDVKRYIEHGEPLHGDFLQAIFRDSLVDAYGRADLANREHLDEWTLFLYNDVPRHAWGSEEAIQEWMEQGGLEGREVEA